MATASRWLKFGIECTVVVSEADLQNLSKQIHKIIWVISQPPVKKLL